MEQHTNNITFVRKANNLSLKDMIPLNLPITELRFCQRGSRTYVFDRFRKKFVALTPEEWVRQHFLSWLTQKLGYPMGLIAVEVPLKYNNLQKRADAVVYHRSGDPLMIVECKAPHITISQDAFSQAAAYNFNFNSKYMVLTNGMEHYCCTLDAENKTFGFLEEIPPYAKLM